MEIIIKAVVLGLGAALMASIIKKTNGELSSLLVLCGSVMILTLALKLYGEIRDTLLKVLDDTIFSLAYISPIFKCVGIGLCGKLGSDICRDSGQGSLASAIETCSAFCAVYVSLPLIEALLSLVGELT